MKFEELLAVVGDQPLFETGLLLAGDVDANDVRRQLSRWVRSGRIQKLRRGLYTLVPPYQTVIPHPFVVANALLPGSYVSLQSALAFHGLIPEYAPRTLSITTQRPSSWKGGYQFHHLADQLFFGYEFVEVAERQDAFVATPEKALLDLAHLTSGSDTPEYLAGLRLQNLDHLDLSRLQEFVERSRKPKWRRVAIQMEQLVLQEREEYEELP